MHKLFISILLFVLSGVQLHGSDKLPRLAFIARAAKASQQLRSCCPRQWEMSHGGIPRVKRDIVDDCIAGKPEACDAMSVFIEIKRFAALQAAASIEHLAEQNQTADIEHRVKLLLAPEKHPCHNLTNVSGEPSSGYAFAKNWVQGGSLNTTIAQEYQTLFEALEVFKPASLMLHKKAKAT